MKYLVFISMAAFLPSLVSAQNVGIGTTSPAVKLHVQGNGDQYLRVHSNSAAINGHDSGIRLTRFSPFSSRDWQILNTSSLVFTSTTDDGIEPGMFLY